MAIENWELSGEGLLALVDNEAASVRGLFSLSGTAFRDRIRIPRDETVDGIISEITATGEFVPSNGIPSQFDAASAKLEQPAFKLIPDSSPSRNALYCQISISDRENRITIIKASNRPDRWDNSITVMP